MVLAQPDIRIAVESGLIGFDPPLEPGQWNAASVDLRLGTQFTKLHGAASLKLSLSGGLAGLHGLCTTTMDLPPRNPFGQVNSLCLEPGEFVLAMTHEKVTLPIQPGWSGPIVLEIKNHGPMRVELTPLLDRPCQLTFFQLSSSLPPELTYGAKPSDAFANQTHPLRRSRKEHEGSPA
jgi:deoxycytidine triphosphate deaminase